MNVNIKGRVKNINLPQYNGLLPVFEAVTNSLHAIEECGDLTNKYVKILIFRDEAGQTVFEENQNILPIKSFEIIDNGSGFSDINYESFQTSDTTHKEKIGGKGIGRLLWLKAFDSARIESYYIENEKNYFRSFDFVYDDKGIKNHTKVDSDKKINETKVLLQNFKKNYQTHTPKKVETLAFNILEHHLAHFIYNDIPNITIVDVTSKEEIDLKKLFDDKIKPNIKKENFKVKKYDFELAIVRNYLPIDNIHKIHFCGHGRDVKCEKLKDYITLFQNKFIQNDTKTFISLSYVSSVFLDNNINQERTGFIIPNSLNENDIYDENLIFLSEIREKSIELIKHEFEEFLTPIKNVNKSKIEKFINENNPEYKPLVLYKSDKLENIPCNIGDEKLEIELHKLKYELSCEIKLDSQKLIKENSDIQDVEEYKQKYTTLLSKLNDFGKTQLTDYIIHRRIILQLLKKRLSLNNGKYEKEDAIHELIFPLKNDSDEISYNCQNLWLIDERLSYHYYLASDKPLSSNPIVKSDSDDRPDLIIFNTPFAFVEDECPYSSIVIIEFKRPMRKNYAYDENPIEQVIGYMKKIKDGTVLSKDGRPIQVNQTTPFYAYIICDLTDKIKNYAESSNFKNTPDAMGYFYFHDRYNAYIEIISFDKLLNDSIKRNRVLFEKLGLSCLIKNNDLEL